MLHRIPTRFSAITAITYIFSWKMYSKPLKDIQNKSQPEEGSFKINVALLSIILWTGYQNCSVIYSIPEDKEKRFDCNICEGLNDNRALSEIDM